MAKLSKVWGDADGISIRAGGYVARPGPVNGYEHAYAMDDGGLAAGQYVKAVHLGGSPLVRITLEDGTKRYWHNWPHPSRGAPS